MNEDYITEYRSRYKLHLIDIASRLETHIRELVADLPRIDRVTARAKDPASFSGKAQKTLESGSPKYIAPLIQIQDQIGARVIVLFRDDVARVGAEMERYFRAVERKDIVPDSHWAFGYFGHHWIFALPDDVVPSDVPAEASPRFFELQVKTLFQHAWSEANHDLGYKSPQQLLDDQERRLAFTSAQAWGADRVFDELRAELTESRSDH